jgi:hypothetical protein
MSKPFVALVCTLAVLATVGWTTGAPARIMDVFIVTGLPDEPGHDGDQ